MEIGVIGVGCNILNLVLRASNSGYTIYMNNPFGNHYLRDIVAVRKNIKLVDTPEAAAPEIILLFLPFDQLEKVVGSLPDMTGKIILHTGNPIFNTLSPNVEISGNSAATKTAMLLPKSDVIKLYHEIHTVSDTGNKNNSKPKIFFSGENPEAKKKTSSLLETLNFSGIDLTDKTGFSYI